MHLAHNHHKANAHLCVNPLTGRARAETLPCLARTLIAPGVSLLSSHAREYVRVCVHVGGIGERGVQAAEGGGCLIHIP